MWFVHSCVSRLQRLVKDLLKQLQGQESGQWANNRVTGLDRTLGEISRILEKQVGQVGISDPRAGLQCLSCSAGSLRILSPMCSGKTSSPPILLLFFYDGFSFLLNTS